MAGSQTLMAQMGVDPFLSQTLSLITSPLIDGIQTGQIGETFVKIVPQLSTQASLIGFQHLGNMIGLDPRISLAFGTPIAASIGQGLEMGNLFGQNIIKGIQDGIVAGAVGYGVNFASDAISGDSALAAALISRTFTGLIDGALNPNGNTLKSAFDALSESLGNLSKSMTTAEFAQLVGQKGLIRALEENATAIFTRDALEEIVKAGGIAQILNGNARYTNLTFGNGNPIPVKEVNIGSMTLYYSAYNDQNLYGRKIGNRFERGYFAADGQGGFGLYSGEVEIDLGSGMTMEVRVNNFQAQGYELKKDGNPILSSYALNGRYSMGADLSIDEGVLESKKTGAKILFRDGKVQEIYIPGPENQTFDIKGSFPELTEQGLENFVKYVTITAGGVWNTEPEGNIPHYLEGLNQSILEAGGDSSRVILPIPLYENSPGFVEDAGLWLQDMATDRITNEMLDKLYQRFMQNPDLQTKGATMVLYSGSGQPGLRANDKAGLNVKSLVLIGAPSVKFNIDNPNTDTVVNIFGSADPFSVAIRSQFYSGHNLNQFNIMIKGVGHSYMEDLNLQRNPNPDPVKVKVQREIAEVIKISIDPLVLSEYLKTITWYTKDPVSGFFILDPDKLLENIDR